jgi:hypothetical protein
LAKFVGETLGQHIVLLGSLVSNKALHDLPEQHLVARGASFDQ